MDCDVHVDLPGISDHTPLILSFTIGRDRINKPFKFFNFWMRNKNFKEVLRKGLEIYIYKW